MSRTHARRADVFAHRSPLFPAVLAGLLLLGGAATAADGPTPEQVKFFESEVRPVLAANCFKCHGEEKQNGNLRLDSLSAALAGGDSGPAVVPGKPDESLLVEAINHAGYEMPPNGKLKDAEIAALTKWVEAGAPWPGSGGDPVAATPREKISDEDRAFWSFQPVRDPAVPAVDDAGWSRNPIDQFVFARLAAEGLGPAPEADKAALIRRVTFDLTGLPPTPEEVDAFVADDSSDAYDRLVTRLLDSPRYGERWARHWLDLVRYAESDGFRQDAYRPNAWHYRDYVVRAFNDDKPYDRFVLEQLAGDEIAPNDPDALAATGYLRHWNYEYNQRDAVTQRTEILNDVTDVTADVFLGLGMGCARCHDHKFDPILQKDYYTLQAFFAGLLPRDDRPLATPEQVAAYEEKLAHWEAMTSDVRAKLEAIEGPARERAAEAAIKMFPEETQAIVRKPAAERTAYERQIADLVERQVLFEYTRIDGKIEKAQKEEWENLKKELAKFNDAKPVPPPIGMTVADAGPVAPPVTIPDDRRGELLGPTFPTVLGGEPAKPEPLKDSTGRRTALARWIARPDNPLTTRVVVNRIWQYHFGRGLVSTSSDFGTLGERPSHLELLDWLTTRFVEGGWRFKELHRLIVTSSTYRQSAFHPHADAALLKDPENRLLWRANTRRLAGEQVRDAMLAASGELDLSAGGPSVDGSRPRRTIYTKTIRNTPDPLLQAFDVPEGFGSTPQRNVTTTATQSLLMVNGDWVIQRAKSFASRLRKVHAGDDAAAIRSAYRLAFGREPASDETTAALSFLDAQRGIASKAEPTPVPGSMPHRQGQAAVLQPKSGQRQLELVDEAPLPKTEFTVEAFVLLESLAEDASVRTIVSQWDDDKLRHGWSLGVTSTKSAYTPRNLILQFVGPDAVGKTVYEVVPSFLHLELNKPYYVGVAVKLGETGEAGVTFYTLDISDNEATLQVARVKHQVVGPLDSPAKLVVGGRDGNEKQGWHGLIDDVRISDGVLGPDKLLLEGEGMLDATVAYWRFEGRDFFRDQSGRHLSLRPSTAGKSGDNDPLVALCHVLLNANEFLYVD